MSEIKTNKLSSATSNSDITIDPDGTGDVVVASGHKLGIGTTSPDHTLTVSASSSPVLEIEQTSGGPYKTNIVLNGNDTEFRGSSGNIEFYTGNADGASSTERMRIDSSGRVSIGTNTAHTADSLLTLQNSGGSAELNITSGTSGGSVLNMGDTGDYNIGRIKYDQSSNSMQFNTNNAERVRIDSSGNLGVGVTSMAGSNRLYSSGSYSATTGSGANLVIQSNGLIERSVSSQRYKNTINDATHGLTELMTLRPVTYKHNNNGDTVFGGLIAEEVHTAGLTEFVVYSEDDNGDDQPEALHYGNMVSLCIKAIQELKTELNAEKVKTATLETKVAALEAAE